jgi:peptidoglycan-associated lipoprotein
VEKLKMKLTSSVIALFVAAFLVVGCSSTEEMNPGLTDGSKNGVVDASASGYADGSGISSAEMQAIDSQGYGQADGYAGDQNYGAGGTGAPNSPEFSDPLNPLSKRVIYFMYDSSQIQPDFEPVIIAHASYLLANVGQRMVLEGNADERGSREYNIALGEQRANAIARLLKMQGVSPTQLEIVSYGEEKPAVEGFDEAAWQLNRRVELVYQ